MDADLAAIWAGLQRLQTIPIVAGDLSAEEHEYRLNPLLSEDQVQGFEAEHRIILPGEYRAFLTQLGNGGAGPGYGLEKLGHAMCGQTWSELQGMVGDLAVPFPYSTDWNEETIDSTQPIEEQYRQQDNYWSSRHVTGAIPICEHGCNLRECLIVTGEERGNIWFDDRADWNGLYPDKTTDRKRLTFLEWYRRWLDDRLTKAGCGIAEPLSCSPT